MRLRHLTALRPTTKCRTALARGPTYLELSTKFDAFVKILATQGNLDSRIKKIENRFPVLYCQQGEPMIRFSTVELMDEQKCYDYLVEILHPDGLCCPECESPVEQSKVH